MSSIISYDTDQLVNRFMEEYGLRELQARQAVNSTSCVRLLNLLAKEQGLLDESTAVALTSERERLEQEREQALAETARLQEERRKTEAAKAAAERAAAELKEMRDGLAQDLDGLETAEMRDRVRALHLFRKMTREDVDRLTECAAILAGDPAVLKSAV